MIYLLAILLVIYLLAWLDTRAGETELHCFNDSESSTTASQPVANVTGAGSPTSQGDNSPIGTGQSVASKENKGNINTGTAVDASKDKTTASAGRDSSVITGTVIDTKIGDHNVITTDGGAVNTALEALKGALGTAQTNIATLATKIGSTPTPNAPVTTAGDTPDAVDTTTQPDATDSATKTAAVQTALQAVAAVIAGVMLLFLIFRKKKTA